MRSKELLIRYYGVQELSLKNWLLKQNQSIGRVSNMSALDSGTVKVKTNKTSISRL